MVLSNFIDEYDEEDDIFDEDDNDFLEPEDEEDDL